MATLCQPHAKDKLSTVNYQQKYGATGLYAQPVVEQSNIKQKILILLNTYNND